MQVSPGRVCSRSICSVQLLLQIAAAALMSHAACVQPTSAGATSQWQVQHFSHVQHRKLLLPQPSPSGPAVASQGIFLPAPVPADEPEASPPSQTAAPPPVKPGLYLPTVPAAAPAQVSPSVVSPPAQAPAAQQPAAYGSTNVTPPAAPIAIPPAQSSSPAAAVPLPAAAVAAPNAESANTAVSAGNAPAQPQQTSGLAAAIAVPLVVVAVVVAALLLLLWRRRRRKRGGRTQPNFKTSATVDYQGHHGSAAAADAQELRWPRPDSDESPLTHTKIEATPLNAVGSSFSTWFQQQQHAGLQHYQPQIISVGGRRAASFDAADQRQHARPPAVPASAATAPAGLPSSMHLATAYQGDHHAAWSSPPVTNRHSAAREQEEARGAAVAQLWLSKLSPLQAGTTSSMPPARSRAASIDSHNSQLQQQQQQQTPRVDTASSSGDHDGARPTASGSHLSSPFARIPGAPLPFLSAAGASGCSYSSANSGGGSGGWQQGGAVEELMQLATSSRPPLPRTHTPTPPPTPQNADQLSPLQAVTRPAKPVTGRSRQSWVYPGGSAPGGIAALLPASGAACAARAAGANSSAPAATRVEEHELPGGTEASVGTSFSSATSSTRAVPVLPSIAAPASRLMSSPALEYNWDFQKASCNPVRVLLQVNEDAEMPNPVTLLLLVSAPPPRPEVLAQVVLPSDPPQADVNLNIDVNTDLAFPSNSFVGAGAFGQVHRALYKNRIPVAVKMLTDPELRSADTDTMMSFHKELGIMARLQHPHIVRCYGGNLDCLAPFIVTELCECSLDKVISHFKRHTGAGLPLRLTLTIGLHIASALWHLHPSIVHRDLKPQNVLLDAAGTAKVADFGLSRMKTHSYVSTRHIEAGTASYMAPECFIGEGVNEKIDVYSLAMLLWECVTGDRPWKGHNMMQVAYQVAMSNNRPPLPPISATSCPPELAQLMSDMWAANPRERPSSGEVMKALAQMVRVMMPV